MGSASFLEIFLYFLTKIKYENFYISKQKLNIKLKSTEISRPQKDSSGVLFNETL